MKAIQYFKSNVIAYGYIVLDNIDFISIRPLQVIVDDLFFPAGGLVQLREDLPIIQVPKSDIIRFLSMFHYKEVSSNFLLVSINYY